MFVFLTHLLLARVDLAFHTRGKHVIDRRFVGVLFYVDGGHLDRCRIVVYKVVERLGISTPLPFDQFQTCETKVHVLAEARQVHSHVLDGLETAHAADSRIIILVAERNFELIPTYGRGFPVFQGNAAGYHVRNEIAAHDHVLGTQGNLVLEIFLGSTHGVVQVYVFDIGIGGGRRGVVFVCRIHRRVAFHAVIILVTVEYAGLLFVIIAAPVMVEIISGRVVQR